MEEKQYFSRVKEAWNIFGASYKYRQQYNQYKASRIADSDSRSGGGIDMPRCRKCGAEIRFIRMKSGKYMPDDAERKPYREGENEVFITDGGEKVRGGTPFGNEPVDGFGYTPHWATCPCADDFRRK